MINIRNKLLHCYIVKLLMGGNFISQPRRSPLVTLRETAADKQNFMKKRFTILLIVS